jgi:hypothetical protein
MGAIVSNRGIALGRIVDPAGVALPATKTTKTP